MPAFFAVYRPAGPVWIVRLGAIRPAIFPLRSSIRIHEFGKISPGNMGDRSRLQRVLERGERPAGKQRPGIAIHPAFAINHREPRVCLFCRAGTIGCFKYSRIPQRLPCHIVIDIAVHRDHIILPQPIRGQFPPMQDAALPPAGNRFRPGSGSWYPMKSCILECSFDRAHHPVHIRRTATGA